VFLVGLAALVASSCTETAIACASVAGSLTSLPLMLTRCASFAA